MLLEEEWQMSETGGVCRLYCAYIQARPKRKALPSSADLGSPQELRKYGKSMQEALALGCLGAVWARGALVAAFGPEMPEFDVMLGNLSPRSSVVFHTHVQL